MPISIRERRDRRTTLLSPLELEVAIELDDPALQRIPLEMGFDGTASHFLAFSLKQRAEVLIERKTDDPYGVHVGAYVSRRDERTSIQFIDSVDGSSGWRLLPAGDYLIVVSMPFSVIQIRFDLIFGARAYQIEAYGTTGIGSSLDSVGLLDEYFPDSIVDDQVVTRYRPFTWDLQLDTSPDGPYDFSFAGWTGNLEIYGDDPNVPIYVYPLDGDAIQTGRLTLSLLPWQAAVLPDAFTIIARGRRTNGRQYVLVTGNWTAIEPIDGPEPIDGRPATVDLTVLRHSDFDFAYDLNLIIPDAVVDFGGWSGWIDLWNQSFTFRYARVPLDVDNEPLDYVLGAIPSQITTWLPDGVQMRSWLVDQDGGTHWLARGDWSVINGYTRANENIVRDDRTIVSGADIDYRINLLTGLGATIDYSGCTGYIQFSQLDGRPFGNAADSPVPIVDSGWATSEMRVVIPNATTRHLPPVDVAMRMFLVLPIGAGEILVAAGRWSVLRGYTIP